MGDIDCQSTAFLAAKFSGKALELFRAGHHVRIVLMYYLNLEKFFNQPDADLNHMLAEVSESPPQKSIF